nr:right-handed parallel beta-helix repeat-containing protein [Saprospiraceae bacterium]
ALLLFVDAAFAQPFLELYPGLETAGVNIYLSALNDPETDVNASVSYRPAGISEWRAGFPLTNVPAKNRLSGSLFWLMPATTYEVQVELNDPTTPALNGTFTGNLTTRSEVDFSPATFALIVSPDGTGTACSDAQPCGLSTALEQVEAGQDIELKGGVYYTGGLALTKGGTADAPITLRSKPGEQAILDGSDPEPYIWQPVASQPGVFFTPLKGANFNVNCVVADGVRLYPYAKLNYDLVNLELGCILAQPVPAGVSGMSRDPRDIVFTPFPTPNPYFKKLFVHFADNSNPADHDMAISTQKTCLVIENQSFIRFRNLVFRRYGVAPGRTAIQLRNCDEIVFDHCRFEHNDLSIVADGNSDRLTVQFCTFLDNTDWDTYLGKATYEPGTPLLCYGQLPDPFPYNDRVMETGGVFFDFNFTGRGAMLRGNTFSGFMDGTKGAPPPGSVEVDYTQEFDIFDNLINGGDDGIELEGQSGNLRFYRNTLRDCGAAISLAPVRYGPVFLLRNVISDFHETHFTITGSPVLNWSGGLPFKFQSGADVKIGNVYAFHNTVCVMGSGQANGLQVYPGSSQMEGFTAKNNIFFAEKNRALFLRSGGDQLPPLDLDYNNYVCSDTLVRVQLSTGIQYFSGLPGFSGAFGLEMHGLNADPLFADTSAHDFHLKTGSPCINTGVVIPGINDRWYGGLAPDLGAFEADSILTTASPDASEMFSISPNPATNRISVKTPGMGDWALDLYNLQGQKFGSAVFSGNQFTWNLENLPAGAYMLVLNRGAVRWQTRVFLKE